VLIPSAFAQAPGAAPDGAGLQMIILFVIMGAFLLFTFRSQSKRAKEHKQMVDGLQKGDEVVAASGIVGKVTDLGEQYLTIEVAKDVEIKVQKAAVQLALPKGSIKAIK